MSGYDSDEDLYGDPAELKKQEEAYNRKRELRQATKNETEENGRILSIMTASPEFTIKIENIHFKIIGKVSKGATDYTLPADYFIAVLGFSEELQRDYINMNYYSVDVKPYSLFWIYPSKSELGVWRLAGTNVNNKQMNKLDSFQMTVGSFAYYIGDYVQSTLIHLDLQSFINANLAGLPQLEKRDAMNLMGYINGLPNVESNPLRQITNDICSMPYSLAYGPNLVLCPRTSGNMLCPPPLDKTSKILNPSIRAIHKESPTFPFPFIYASISHKLNPDEYPPDKKMERGSLPSVSNQCGETGNLKIIKTLSTLIQNIYDIQSVEKVGDHENRFRGIIHSRGEIFKTTLIKKSHIDPAFLTYEVDYSTRIPNPTTVTINPDVDILPIVDLYFLKTKLECVTDESNPYYPIVNLVCSDRFHYMPMLLTVPETRVNAFGVYTLYINAGAFVCKMFDYLEQCDETEAANFQCTERYAYVGDRYNELFPFTEFNREETGKSRVENVSPMEEEPFKKDFIGGKRKRKTKKNRSNRRRFTKRISKRSRKNRKTRRSRRQQRR
jgi:hypothetical protein